jgi:hypothetical protein
MSTVAGLFGSKKTVPVAAPAKLVKALPPTAVRRPLEAVPEEKEEKKAPVTKGKKPSPSAESTKTKIVEKVKAVVKEAVHDAVSDSDTESYYDDVDNLSGSDEPEFDEDGDPSKRTMARAVKKVGSRNVALTSEVKELRAELKAATSMIAKLQATVDSAAASKAEKKKAAEALKKAEVKAEKIADKIEEKKDE